MTCEADLSAEHAVASHLARSGYAHLGCAYGIFAYYDVVTYLDEVVEFHAAAYDRRAHSRAVYAGVCAYLHIVFYHDVAYLWYFGIRTVGIGGESETVGAYYRSGMYGYIVAYAASCVYLDPGVYRRPFAYCDTVAYVDMRIYACAVAYFRAGFYYRESSYVTVGSYTGVGRDVGLVADAAFARLVRGIQFEQFGERSVGVVHFDESGVYSSGRYETAVDDHYRRTGFVYVVFVFRVCYERKRTFAAFLYFGEFGYFGSAVAHYVASQVGCDHFCGKFHVYR